MKIDHAAREDAKRKKMAHPDWHKYSGFPPAEVVRGHGKKAKVADSDKTPETDSDENGDSN